MSQPDTTATDPIAVLQQERLQEFLNRERGEIAEHCGPVAAALWYPPTKVTMSDGSKHDLDGPFPCGCGWHPLCVQAKGNTMSDSGETCPCPDPWCPTRGRHAEHVPDESSTRIVNQCVVCGMDWPCEAWKLAKGTP